MHVSSVNQDKTVEQEEKKKDAGRRKRGRSKNKEEEETLENKVNIVGFKPTAAHRDFLKSKAMSWFRILTMTTGFFWSNSPSKFITNCSMLFSMAK
jgi:hypothetical protein